MRALLDQSGLIYSYRMKLSLKCGCQMTEWDRMLHQDLKWTLMARVPFQAAKA